MLLASILGVALLTVIVALVVLETRHEERNLLVTHSLEVRSAIQTVEGLLVDAETGVRGYLLTDNPEFLAPYDKARVSLAPALDRLEQLVADEPTQRDRGERVRRAAERRVELNEEHIALTEGGADEETRLAQLEFGKALMDGIRADLATMQAEQDRLLEARIADAESTQAILAALIPAAGMVGLLGLVTTVTFAVRVTRRVARLTENAVRLGEGQPLDPMRRTDDEVGRLGDALVEAAGLLHVRQEQLRTTREFLEYLIDEGPVVMFREQLGESHQLTYVSPNVERVLGVAETAAIGRERFFSSLLSPEDRARFAARVEAAAHAETSGWYGEYRTAAHHGIERWVAVEVRVQPTAAGDPEYLLGYVLDITARVAASSAAQIAEERYRQLFEEIPTGMLTTLAPGQIVDANPAFARMVGFDSVADLLREVPDIGAMYAEPEERVGVLEALERDGAVNDYEVRFRRRDGSLIQVALNARMVPGAAGAPGRFEGTAIDVTTRRRAEDDARRAQADADRANQAKSTFLSRMSHELRTPLNSILGFAQLLELSDPPLDARSRESIRHILKGGRHLLDLIDEVLDIARVEAGNLTMSIEPVEVRDTLSESNDLIGPLAAARDITVSIQGDVRGDHVLADRQRLKQVFLNLLSNAIKYNKPGGRVDVTCTTTNGRVEIAFSDTGPGIGADQLARLFTPFERLGAEQGDQQGTGLGLVLSRHLVEAMAGVLAVESAPGEGSTFTVSLPRTDPHDLHPPKDDKRATGADGRAAGVARTVLYVEDNLANLRLIERILGLRSDISLLSAMQGRVGIDLARQHTPDLILLDLNLPDLSGRDVLVELKSDPATRHIPVLVISADASPGQVQRLIEAGATGYITKPVDVSDLLDQLDGLLGAG